MTSPIKAIALRAERGKASRGERRVATCDLGDCQRQCLFPFLEEALESLLEARCSEIAAIGLLDLGLIGEQKWNLENRGVRVVKPDFNVAPINHRCSIPDRRLPPWRVLICVIISRDSTSTFGSMQTPGSVSGVSRRVHCRRTGAGGGRGAGRRLRLPVF